MKLEIDNVWNIMDPWEIERRPSGEWTAVPSGFLDALKIAKKFTGKHNGLYPWTRHVYLLAGKLYASDNRCIVEIDLGDQSFGDGYFTSYDLEALHARGGDPCLAQLNSACISFAWPDGSWCKVNRRVAELCVNFDHPKRCRALMEKFWHRGQVKIIRGSAEQLEALSDGTWHPPSLTKVMNVAETFDPDAGPTPFSFQNGRGLIVRSSQCERIESRDTVTDGLFYHPDGADLSSIKKRIASGKINPRLDDVFAVAIQETKEEKRASVKRANSMLARLDKIYTELALPADECVNAKRANQLITRRHEINADLVRLGRIDRALDDRLRRQHHALETYQETGEVDEDLLTPKCATLYSEKWKVALDLYRAPDFDRQDRVQLWDRLGSLSPINPGVPRWKWA